MSLSAISPDQVTSPAADFSRLRVAAEPSGHFPNQITWLRQFKRLLPNLNELRTLRLAIMGNGTLHHLAEVMRLWFGLEGFSLEIYVCEYGSFHQEILEPHSAFYAFKPDAILILASERDIHFAGLADGADLATCEAAVSAAADDWRRRWEQIRRHQQVAIVQSNVAPSAISTFGHFEASVPWSRINLIRRLNLALGERAVQEGVSIFDLESIASSYGLGRWQEQRQWYQSKQPFAPDAYGQVAFQCARLIGSMKGTARKCIVLDLDNTLWGGVIGDDGLAGILLGDGAEGEAFASFQAYLLSLSRRGILLAVCSKNEETTARQVFETHPAMRLRLEDIACFRANWRDKAENLRDIAATLNIGLDALVFVDDNPAERALVRAELPAVAVVDMPRDPSEYSAALAAGHHFETTLFSQEDSSRTSLYKDNAKRDAALSSSTDLNSFLRDLDMEADSGPPDSFHLPRMTQLLSKTNQFHLTTNRPTESEMSALAQTAGIWMRWFSLRDKFGDHGLISVAILRPEDDALAIESWAMSCRVFSRGMEDFIFLEMLRAAEESGVSRLIGRYIPTPKNHPVAGLYPRLGFTEDGIEGVAERWVFDMTESHTLPAPYIRHAKRDLAKNEDVTN